MRHPAAPNDAWPGVCFKGGGGSTQPTTTTSTQTSEPWKEQKPFLEFGMGEAQKLYEGDKPGYFPGSTVVPFSPETEAAMAGRTARAVGGSPLLDVAQNETGRTIQGDYLSPQSNPFYNDVMSSTINAIKPQIDTQFARAGRGGTSPLHTEALGRGVGQAMAPYQFGAYGQERGLQQAAAARAPGMAAADYGDIDQLSQVGSEQEAMGRETLEDQINRFNFEQNLPAVKLAEFMQLVSPSYGSNVTGTSTSQQPTYGSK